MKDKSFTNPPSKFSCTLELGRPMHVVSQFNEISEISSEPLASKGVREYVSQ